MHEACHRIILPLNFPESKKHHRNLISFTLICFRTSHESYLLALQSFMDSPQACRSQTEAVDLQFSLVAKPAWGMPSSGLLFPHCLLCICETRKALFQVWNNPPKLYPFSIMYFISHLPMFNSKGRSKPTSHSNSFKMVTLHSLPVVTVARTGACWGEWVQEVVNSSRERHPQYSPGICYPSSTRVMHKPRHEEDGLVGIHLPSGNISLFKINEQQYSIVPHGPTSSTHAGSNAYLPSHLFISFLHYFKRAFHTQALFLLSK